MSRKQTYFALVLVAVAVLGVGGAVARNSGPTKDAPCPTVRSFGAVGDGTADDTAAIQAAVDAAIGLVRLPRGIYRITRPIQIDLDKVGYTSLAGDGVAQIVMAGPGPALRFVGTHDGTAAPATVRPNVWKNERTPSVDAIEIVGDHPQACGIEATGTMQLTLTRVVVRQALHAVHLVQRNRNVILSECHLYENRGIGLFLDGVNLHQINVANCHISYNAGGGIVARGSELRNLQIGCCDIEGNMGDAESEPTANVRLDSAGASIGEVTIVGCTLQHTRDGPHSANIRINGHSTPRAGTDERRHGNVTIADNILSDVQVNVELRSLRAVTLTGNTMWQGFERNLMVDDCANVVVANNVFDRNPRYHAGRNADAQNRVLFVDSADCTIRGNHVYGESNERAAVELRRCRRMNVAGCTILDYGQCGLLLDDVRDSRVSDCLIRDDRANADGTSLSVTGSGNMVVDNLLGKPPVIAPGAAVAKDNVVP